MSATPQPEPRNSASSLIAKSIRESRRLVKRRSRARGPCVARCASATVRSTCAEERATVEKHLNDASKKFDEHLRGVAYRNGRGAALFLAAFCAALWPTDLIVFRRMPEMQSTINWLRIAV